MAHFNPTITYLPIFELTRGSIVESVQFGALAVVDSQRRLVTSHGNPHATSFLRSSAKPFQAMPFIEAGGHLKWDFSNKEIAILCGSHAGTDQHFAVLNSIQEKIRVKESDLHCGVHPPIDQATRKSLERQGREPTPNRHNCSGKHTGMLALARLIQAPIESYLDRDHPVQKQILQTFSEMCDVPVDSIALGIDGCSAPVFAVPLFNAAYGYARLCDPVVLAAGRAEACHTLTSAMMDQPEMVSGPGKFDTRLMEVCRGQIISKGGAEGYQQVGILPGVLGRDSPGVGIALKISDGDARGRARPAVILEVLRQLGAIDQDQLAELGQFGPKTKVLNWRKLHAGYGYPTLSLSQDE